MESNDDSRRTHTHTRETEFKPSNSDCHVDMTLAKLCVLRGFSLTRCLHPFSLDPGVEECTVHDTQQLHRLDQLLA